MLLAALSEGPPIDSTAVSELARLGVSQAAGAIEALLSSEDPHTRSVAAKALGHLRVKDAAVRLGVLAATDPVAFVRAWALHAYAELETGDAEADLIDALDNPDWRVRAVAVQQLGRFGSERALQPLRRGMEREVRLRRRFRLLVVLMTASEDAAQVRAHGWLSRRDYRAAAEEIRKRAKTGRESSGEL